MGETSWPGRTGRPTSAQDGIEEGLGFLNGELEALVGCGLGVRVRPRRVDGERRGEERRLRPDNNCYPSPESAPGVGRPTTALGSLGPAMQFGCETREARGELIHELDTSDRAPSALGDKRVDDGVDPVGLVNEEPLRELVGS